MASPGLSEIVTTTLRNRSGVDGRQHEQEQRLLIA
jgi:hypothetical protein